MLSLELFLFELLNNWVSAEWISVILDQGTKNLGQFKLLFWNANGIIFTNRPNSEQGFFIDSKLEIECLKLITNWKNGLDEFTQ